MSLGGANNAVAGVNLTDAELARIQTTAAGTLTIGDIPRPVPSPSRPPSWRPRRRVPVIVQAGILILDGNSSPNANLTGAGGGGLLKTGGGQSILSGSNDFTGGTVVTDGTLVVNCIDALPTGGSLTIGSGCVVV